MVGRNSRSRLSRCAKVRPRRGSPLSCPPPDFSYGVVRSDSAAIGLQDGQSRRFGPGEHFFSADVLPEGARFDPKLHGHRSAQCGPEPLVTLFLKV